MSFWTRVGLLGSMFYCLHRKRMVYADQKRDDQRRDDRDSRRDDRDDRDSKRDDRDDCGSRRDDRDSRRDDRNSRRDDRNGRDSRRDDRDSRRDDRDSRRDDHDSRLDDRDSRRDDHNSRRDYHDSRREGMHRREDGDHTRKVHEHRSDGDHSRGDEDHKREVGDRRGDGSIQRKNGSDYRRNGEKHRSDGGGDHRRDASEHRTHCNEHRQDRNLYSRNGACSSFNGQEHELKLVQVMYRHGARTPLKPIPHKEQVEWPLSILDVPDHTQFNYTVTSLTGGPQPPSKHEQKYRSTTLKGGSFAGQLTTIGMLQMFKLGERLRKTYIEELHFLTPVFKPSEVFVRSTNIVRNMESTRCLLAGLFQQQQEESVTIVTAEAVDEILFPNYDGCQGLKLLTSNKLLNASSQPGMSEELKKLQREIGIDRENDASYFLLFDNLLAQEVHGLPGTLVLKNLVRRTERRVIDIISYVMDRNRELLQLSVGAFLHTVQENMLEVVNSSTTSQQTRKLFLYAVHDVTLIPMLMALGIFDKKWPPYASDLTLELYQHKRSQEWSARLCYNGEEQVVRGCKSGLCPLKDFLKAISGYVLTLEEYKTLCSNTAKVHEEKAKM